MAYQTMSSLIAARGDGEEVVLLVDAGAERLAADMQRSASHLLDIDILFSASAHRTDVHRPDFGQTNADPSVQTRAAGAGR